MKPHQDNEHPGGVGYLIVLLAIAIVSWFPPRQSSPVAPRFEITPMFPQEERLASVLLRDQALARAHPLDERSLKTVSLMEKFGLAEALAGGNAEDEAYLLAAKETETALVRYWYERGEDAFRALGEHLANRFESAVLAVLARVRAEKADVVQWMKDHASDPLVVNVHRACGSFLSNAHRSGVVSRSGRLVADSRALLRLHSKLRYMVFLKSIKDYTHLLNPEELRALWRWRVAGDQSQTTASRRLFAEQLHGIDPHFPIYEVLGALMAGEGRAQEAISYYREALLDDPFNPQIVANLTVLVERAAAPKDASEPSSR
jgi:tetratricopeptide (TPR) repeat protein